MLGIGLHNNSAGAFHAVVLQYGIQIRHIRSGIAGEHQKFSAVFQVGNDFICLILGEIGGRGHDHKLLGILRDIVCHQGKITDFHIVFINCITEVRRKIALGSLAVAGYPVNLRVVFTRHIRDGAGNLTLAVKAGRLCLIGLIVCGSLPHITVADHLALIAAYDNYTVCSYRLIGILTRKFRIQIRVFCLYFDMVRKLIVVLQQLLDGVILTALLHNIIQGNVLIEIL